MMQKVIDWLKRMYANFYVKTILLALGIVLALIVTFFIYLNIFTRHGRTFPVPDFRGMSHAEIQKMARKKNLRVEITDSVFIVTRRPGSVIEQNPTAGTQVKANRRVFITINAKNPIKVEMPNIIGFTLRQAKSILEQQGIEIGYLSFKPDIAVNTVLAQRYQGREIIAGTMIPKGTRIDLVLSRGMNNEKTGLPQLVGLTLGEARNRIIEASLNIGQFKFDETIKDFKDSLDARVYSQYPVYYEPNEIYFGAKVDLWLTLNQSRIPQLKAVDSAYTRIDTSIIEEVIE